MFSRDPRARDPRGDPRGDPRAQNRAGAGAGAGAGGASSNPLGRGSGSGSGDGADYFVSSSEAGSGVAAVTGKSSAGADAAVEGVEGVASKAAKRSLHVALVCACNMNRSMAAHKLLADNGFTNVESFGTARQVKLPGGPNKAHAFPWGTPYTDIEAKLRMGDKRALEWMNERRIIDMVVRNQAIKRAPEKWQSHKNVSKFDLVVCYEQRVFDTLVEDLQSRDVGAFEPVHVINLEVKDTTAAADVGAKLTLRLAAECAHAGAEGLAMDIDNVLKRIRKFTPGEPQYFLQYL